jgi:hypothetical protein
MGNTRGDRRTWIQNKHPSITEILRKYPRFQDIDETVSAMYTSGTLKILMILMKWSHSHRCYVSSKHNHLLQFQNMNGLVCVNFQIFHFLLLPVTIVINFMYSYGDPIFIP